MEYKKLYLINILLFTILIVCKANIEPSKLYTEAEAWDLGWPQMNGPFGNFLPARTGIKLVEDLKDVRVVWESEERDFGRGKCSTGLAGKILKEPTTFCGLGSTQHGGSWAGPIVAEGKIFGVSFRPGGKEFQLSTGRVAWEADDLLIALDAHTGKTIWKAVEPGGMMWGMGKRQGWQVAPVYHKGRIFSMGTTGRVFAYEAATGKKLWQTDIGTTFQKVEAEKAAILAGLAQGRMPTQIPRYAWHTSLVVAEGTLIVPLFDGHDTSLRGVDVETGKTKWELKAIIARTATPAIWRYQGKEYLLTATIGVGATTGSLNLIEPTTGKILWTVKELSANWFSLAPSETHVLINTGSSVSSKNNKPFGLLSAYRITLEKAEKVWTFPDEPKYRFPNWMDCCAMRRVLIRDGLVYVDLYSNDILTEESEQKEIKRAWFIICKEDTGEIVAEYENTNKPEPDRISGLIYLIEDRIFCRANASHAPSHGGRHPFTMFRLTDKGPVRIPGELDRHELATGYEVFMENPIVAGHIWMRDERGFIVCYDLRAN